MALGCVLVFFLVTVVANKLTLTPPLGGAFLSVYVMFILGLMVI